MCSIFVYVKYYDLMKFDLNVIMRHGLYKTQWLCSKCEKQ